MSIDVEKHSKEEILEAAAETAVKWLVNVFKISAVPAMQALKTMIKAAQLSDTEMQVLDKDLSSLAKSLGKEPLDLSPSQVAIGVYMALLEKSFVTETKPTNHGGSIDVAPHGMWPDCDCEVEHP